MSNAVLIVGAGPVGLSAGVALAQAGIPIRIVDRLITPTNESRAAIVHARTLEHFERLGFVEDFLAAGVKVRGAAIYGPGNKLLVRPSLDHLPTPFPFMLGLEQFETERLLTARLDKAGAAVERGVELIDLEDSAGHVAARLRHADGSEATTQFAYVLGCDGARSTVRGVLGLHMEGETLDTIWMTADVKIRWDRDPDEAITYLSSEGIAFIAPMNDNRWRVVINLPTTTKEEAEKLTLDDIQAIVRGRFGADVPLYDPVWISPFGINTRMAPTMHRGRIFLAGDAAHVHSPVGGQGMNTGIQDILNLTWKLALVLRGAAKPELLDSYNAERHANARRLLARIGPATKMASLRHPVAIEVRNWLIHLLGELGLSHAMPRIVSMLDVAYPDSPIVSEAHAGWLSSGPHAGDRAPDTDGLLCAGHREPQRLFTIWSGNDRHQLLHFTANGASVFPASSLYSITGIVREGTPSDGVIVDADGHAHEAYSVGKPGPCFLVRPDGVIAFRSGEPDATALLEYLRKWYLSV
jgi:2-polyprenyl-6-methoxyphenol hydroxylase-like FAD-dependent oxidoreductase